jgi:hypothetical protein
MFADKQVILSSDEDKMQQGLVELYKIAKELNLRTSKQKTKLMSLYGKWPIRSKIILED